MDRSRRFPTGRTPVTRTPFPPQGEASHRRLARAALAAAALGAGAAQADDVTVAFLGDQGARQEARDVLSLIANEGADLVVSGGDLGYGRGPVEWIAMMDGILGDDFPVLAAVGNHEEDGWPEYQAWLERRVDAVDGLECEGEVGVKARCTFRGITVVQTAPDIHEVPGIDPDDDYAGYIRDTLSRDTNAWRICSWHKPHREMQVGAQSSKAVGLDVYEACREGGAVAATAHEHSYARTHLMSDFVSKRVVHRNAHLEIGPGRSFAFVSGLGGRAPRAQARGGDWWASVYTATQGATNGALFCTFGERRASCEFKAVDGATPDRFTLETRNARPKAPAGAPRAGDRTPAAPAESDSGSSSDDVLPAPTILSASRYSSRSGEIFWARPTTSGLRHEVLLDGEVVLEKAGTSATVKDLSKGRARTFEVVAIAPDGRRSAPASVTVGAEKGSTSSTSPASGGEPVSTGGNGAGDGGSGADDAGADVPIARASTSVPGELGVRLDVYDRRSYELFWERVPGIVRYRLSSGDGELVEDVRGTSRYFRDVDSSLERVYRIEALDADGRTVRRTRVRVSPSSSAQLVALD